MRSNVGLESSEAKHDRMILRGSRWKNEFFFLSNLDNRIEEMKTWVTNAFWHEKESTISLDVMVIL